MRSILLCEGPDDLWFSAYYLHKVAGWDTCNTINDLWPLYKVYPANRKQLVEYMSKGIDSVAIWCVAGKDAFDLPIATILDKFISAYPFDPVNSIVILRDRDTDTEESVLAHISALFCNKVTLSNHSTSVYSESIDGEEVRINITPVLIPFNDCGAIESLLMASIREENTEGQIIVDEACSYIDGLVNNHDVGQLYLTHAREIIKAKFAATIAATNPGHATGLFQDLVMSCPWEKSEYVKSHFDVIVHAVTTPID